MEIYVGNLSYNVTEGDLIGQFEAFGTVDQLKVILDRDTGRPRGFAFVTMNNDEEAKAAIEGLNGVDYAGREMSVREATPRAPRTGGGGGGGGGGFRGGDRRGGGGGHRGGGDRRGGGGY